MIVDILNLDHYQAVVQKLKELQFHEGNSLHVLARREWDDLGEADLTGFGLVVDELCHCFHVVKDQLHVLSKLRSESYVFLEGNFPLLMLAYSELTGRS